MHRFCASVRVSVPSAGLGLCAVKACGLGAVYDKVRVCMSPAQEGSFVLWQHNAGVTGLSYEDPWLATSSADGSTMLINTQTQRKAGTARCDSAHQKKE